MTSATEHGDRTPEPAPRALSAAERCRTLAASARLGALSTLARDPDGYPYGSLVTVAVDAHGRPLLLLSSLAEHTQNLAHRLDASVLLAEAWAPPQPGAAETPAARSPLAAGRVTILGPCALVPDSDRDAVKAIFLAAHPEAAGYVDFKDFAFHRLEPVALRYIGGFGRMSWVSADDYRAAEPDPLAPVAAAVLSHMNGDHADAVLAYARGLAGIANANEATMTSVDRYGFDLAVVTPEGAKTARLAFDAPVATADEVRRAMVALVKAARAALA